MKTKKTESFKNEKSLRTFFRTGQKKMLEYESWSRSHEREFGLQRNFTPSLAFEQFVELAPFGVN